MRLIDADAITDKEIAEYLGCYASCVPDIRDLLNDQPTAYDVKSVTDEILRASCMARPVGWSRKKEIVETCTAVEIIRGGFNE